MVGTAAQNLSPVVAAGLVAIGSLEILSPKSFTDIGTVFLRAQRDLDAETQARLRLVLDARLCAQSVSPRAFRFVGMCTVLMAGFVFVPGIPMVLPYAGACLAMAVAIVLTYSQLHHTARRVAVLAPRKSLVALAPATLISAIFALGCVAGVVMAPGFRVAGGLIAASTTAILWTAWRVADAPAFLPGNDPEMELAVDDRIRRNRVNGLCVLATAPIYALFNLMHWGLPHTEYFLWLYVAAMITFPLALTFNLRLQYRRLVVA